MLKISISALLHYLEEPIDQSIASYDRIKPVFAELGDDFKKSNTDTEFVMQQIQSFLEKYDTETAYAIISKMNFAKNIFPSEFFESIADEATLAMVIRKSKLDKNAKYTEPFQSIFDANYFGRLTMINRDYYIKCKHCDANKEEREILETPPAGLMQCVCDFY